jgi:hypothetical protein
VKRKAENENKSSDNYAEEEIVRPTRKEKGKQEPKVNHSPTLIEA